MTSMLHIPWRHKVHKFSNTHDAYVISILGELNGNPSIESMMISAESDSEAIGSAMKSVIQSGALTSIASWTTIKVDPETLEKIGVVEFIYPEKPVITIGKGAFPSDDELADMIQTPPYAPGEG